MATSDLLAELSKDSFRAAPDVEKKVVAVVLKQLDDQSGDVSTLAVKCLPPLVRNCSAPSAVDVVHGLVERLCAEEGKDARARRDAGGIGLKTVLAETPAAHANAGAASRGLAKQGIVPPGAKGRALRKEEATNAGVKRACLELKKSIKNTEQDAAEFERNIVALEEERASAVDEIEQTEAALRELRAREEELRLAHEGVDRERTRARLEAQKNERMLSRFEELRLGTYATAGDEDAVRAEFEKARHRREKLVDAIGDICADAPHLEAQLGRALTLLSL